MPKGKIKCRGCGKSHGVMKFYVIADDIENPVPYHPRCFEKFRIKMMLAMSDEDHKRRMESLKKKE